MINVTRWKPDTCECVLEFSWDNELPESERTHTLSNVVSKCEAHASENNLSNHWNKVMDENPRKNKLMARLEQFTELLETNPDGSTKINGKLVSWQYNADRVLEISISGLTTQKKALAQSWADSNIGIGKVIII